MSFEIVGSHRDLAYILLYIILSKQNVQKIGTGTYLAVCSVGTLKGFCMAKSVQNLDMNRVLSKCEFIGSLAL